MTFATIEFVKDVITSSSRNSVIDYGNYRRGSKYHVHIRKAAYYVSNGFARYI